jgi:hypothetical protein
MLKGEYARQAKQGDLFKEPITAFENKFIVMTNALKGQGGHHHVNEQPTEYWVNHLRKYNYEVLSEDTNRVRKLAEKDGAIYLAKTGLVLAKGKEQ